VGSVKQTICAFIISKGQKISGLHLTTGIVSSE